VNGSRGPTLDAPPRYSARPLPPYRFIPGETPHPTRDPGGHSRAGTPSPLEPWNPDEWRTLDAWRWAVDLFNYAYWWEAHEALEGLWHAAGRTTPPARFTQSLVHLSAALLNRRRGHAAAARRQAARALRGLRAARALGPVVMGIDLARLSGDVRVAFADDGPAPRIVLQTGRE
jgi:hypothetical protein